MNKIVAAAAVLLVLAGPSWAAASGDDALKAQLARCAAVHDALNRLECFDLLARSLGLNPGSTAPEAPAASATPPVSPPVVSEPAPIPESTTTMVSGWRVVIKRDDKGRLHIVTLETTAAQGVGVRGTPVTLSLRCMDRETSAFINWESYVGDDSVPVTVNVGGAGASRSNWKISSNGTMTYYPGKTVPFVQSLLSAKQLDARVNPYGGHEVSANFDLSGLVSAIQPLRQACRW